MFNYLWSNSNTLFLASNEQTSNNWTIAKFTELLIEQTWNPIFRTLNELKPVHLPICNCTQVPYFWLWTIELRTYFDTSLLVLRNGLSWFGSLYYVKTSLIWLNTKLSWHQMWNSFLNLHFLYTLCLTTSWASSFQKIKGYTISYA